MWDEPLNTTIDEVARQMTDGSPNGGADLRRRVLERIESGHSPRRARRASFVLTAIAAAAAIIIALLVTRERRPGPFGPGEMAGPAAQTPQALLAADVAGHAGTTARLEPDTTDAAQPTVRRPPVPHRFSETTVPDTPPLEPLDVAPLTVDVLRPDPISIERLDNIAPIAVAPLDIPDAQRRDR